MQLVSMPKIPRNVLKTTAQHCYIKILQVFPPAAGTHNKMRTRAIALEKRENSNLHLHTYKFDAYKKSLYREKIVLVLYYYDDDNYKKKHFPHYHFLPTDDSVLKATANQIQRRRCKIYISTLVHQFVCAYFVFNL